MQPFPLQALQNHCKHMTHTEETRKQAFYVSYQRMIFKGISFSKNEWAGFTRLLFTPIISTQLNHQNDSVLSDYSPKAGPTVVLYLNKYQSTVTSRGGSRRLGASDSEPRRAGSLWYCHLHKSGLG